MTIPIKHDMIKLNWSDQIMQSCQKQLIIIPSLKFNSDARSGCMNHSEKATRTTNKAMLVKKMTKDILSGKWHPGDKLPSERELAAEMGIGKTVVHSGFEQLAAMGLVTIRPQSGIYVADYMKSGNIELLNSIVHLKGNELGREVVKAILDLRLAIEGMALRALCLCRSAEDIARLRAMTEDIRKSCHDLGEEELAERFFLWHREICILSGKSVLTLFMNTMHNVSIAFWINYLRLFGLPFALDLLEEFTNRIEARDEEGAYNLLASGIADYLSRLEK